MRFLPFLSIFVLLLNFCFCSLPLDATFVRHENIPLINFAPGINLKFPYADPHSGNYLVYLKGEPGSLVGIHKHFGEVFAYTISGAWYYEEHEWIARTGDFIWEHPGTTHTLMISDEEETEIFFIVSGCLQFLDNDGNTIVLFDWKVAHDMQQDACNKNNIDCGDLTNPKVPTNSLRNHKTSENIKEEL